MPPTDPRAEDVLSFWIGPLDSHGLADDEHRKRWFAHEESFDALVKEKFQAEIEAVTHGQRESWLATPRGRVAYVIVLDQLSRNVFRGTPRMYAADEQARHVAMQGIEHGDDRALAPDERMFLYMPLMHSEELADQERSVALFTALRDSLDGPARNAVAGALPYAERHRDIVKRFGRFPHRNTVLGRTCTGEEMEFLREPGSGF